MFPGQKHRGNEHWVRFCCEKAAKVLKEQMLPLMEHRQALTHKFAVVFDSPPGSEGKMDVVTVTIDIVSLREDSAEVIAAKLFDICYNTPTPPKEQFN